MHKKKIAASLCTLILAASMSFQNANAANFATLKYGMQNTSVYDLQQNLNTLGMMNVSPTGYYGTVTKSSVLQFQKNYGLSQDGVAGSQTLNKINEILSKANYSSRGDFDRASYTIAEEKTVTPSYTSLRYGMSNNLVFDLQSKLKTLGMMTIKPTGYFGTITKSSVTDFQKKYGLTTDGVAGTQTLSKIDTALAQATQAITPSVVKKQWIPGLPQLPYAKGVGAYEGVVLHFTENYSDTAQTEANYFMKNWQNAFVHEFIDPNEIIQTANPNYLSWGAGRIANQRFINIELCHADTKADFEKSFNMYTKRTAEYLFARKLGVSTAKPDGTGTLWSHADVTKYLGGTTHTDPISYLSKWGKSWQDVVNSVTYYYNILASK